MDVSDWARSPSPDRLRPEATVYTPSASTNASVSSKPAVATDNAAYVKLPVAGYWADVKVDSSIAAEWLDKDIAQPATPTPASPRMHQYLDDEVDVQLSVAGDWVDVKVSDDSALEWVARGVARFPSRSKDTRVPVPAPASSEEIPVRGGADVAVGESAAGVASVPKADVTAGTSNSSRSLQKYFRPSSELMLSTVDSNMPERILSVHENILLRSLDSVLSARHSKLHSRQSSNSLQIGQPASPALAEARGQDAKDKHLELEDSAAQQTQEAIDDARFITSLASSVVSNDGSAEEESEAPFDADKLALPAPFASYLRASMANEGVSAPVASTADFSTFGKVPYGMLPKSPQVLNHSDPSRGGWGNFHAQIRANDRENYAKAQERFERMGGEAFRPEIRETYIDPRGTSQTTLHSKVYPVESKTHQQIAPSDTKPTNDTVKAAPKSRVLSAHEQKIVDTYPRQNSSHIDIETNPVVSALPKMGSEVGASGPLLHTKPMPGSFGYSRFVDDCPPSVECATYQSFDQYQLPGNSTSSKPADERCFPLNEWPTRRPTFGRRSDLNDPRSCSIIAVGPSAQPSNSTQLDIYSSVRDPVPNSSAAPIGPGNSPDQLSNVCKGCNWGCDSCCPVETEEVLNKTECKDDTHIGKIDMPEEVNKAETAARPDPDHTVTECAVCNKLDGPNPCCLDCPTCGVPLDVNCSACAMGDGPVDFLKARHESDAAKFSTILENGTVCGILSSRGYADSTDFQNFSRALARLNMDPSQADGEDTTLVRIFKECLDRKPLFVPEILRAMAVIVMNRTDQGLDVDCVDAFTKAKQANLVKMGFGETGEVDLGEDKIFEDAQKGIIPEHTLEWGLDADHGPPFTKTVQYTSKDCCPAAGGAYWGDLDHDNAAIDAGSQNAFGASLFNDYVGDLRPKVDTLEELNVNVHDLSPSTGWDTFGSNKENVDPSWGLRESLRTARIAPNGHNSPKSTVEHPSDAPSTNDTWASAPPTSKDLTITYCAVVKSGDHTVQIPIDEDNVFGPETEIINTSMKTVWKWIVDKKLEDRVTPKDAFDLAREVQPEVTEEFEKPYCGEYDESNHLQDHYDGEEFEDDEYDNDYDSEYVEQSDIERVETNLDTKAAKAEGKAMDNSGATTSTTTSKARFKDGPTTYTIVPKAKVTEAPSTYTTVPIKDDMLAKERPTTGRPYSPLLTNCLHPSPFPPHLNPKCDHSLSTNDQCASPGSPKDMKATPTVVPETNFVEGPTTDTVLPKKDHVPRTAPQDGGALNLANPNLAQLRAQCVQRRQELIAQFSGYKNVLQQHILQMHQLEHIIAAREQAQQAQHQQTAASQNDAAIMSASASIQDPVPPTESSTDTPSDTIETYEQALSWFHMEKWQSDDVVVAVYASRVSDNPENTDVTRKAVEIIAKYRNSQLLRNFLEHVYAEDTAVDERCPSSFRRLQNPAKTLFGRPFDSQNSFGLSPSEIASLELAAEQVPSRVASPDKTDDCSDSIRAVKSVSPGDSPKVSGLCSIPTNAFNHLLSPRVSLSTRISARAASPVRLEPTSAFGSSAPAPTLTPSTWPPRTFNVADAICHNCEKNGHFARDCHELKDWSMVKCTMCRERGHTIKVCHPYCELNGVYADSLHSAARSGLQGPVVRLWEAATVTLGA